MKLFIMMFVVVGALSVSQSFAADSTDCKNIVTDGSKQVNCDQLSGPAKAKCEAEKAPAVGIKKQAS